MVAKTTPGEALDCGHVCPVNPPGYVGGTGYALNVDRSRSMCYACAADEQRAYLSQLKPGERFTVYLSSQGNFLTTWSGEVLARVTRENVTREGFAGRMTHVWARTPDGLQLYGKGSGRGMCLNVRGSLLKGRFA